ncbi:MAG: radical SAM protein [Nitrospiraceae bacterium]|nr:MAG: radical SAM protein [Nitrospiraceae bacterium]
MTAPSLLLLIPPLTQLNTPYPSTAYLTGFLRSRGYAVAQADIGLEMVLGLFSRAGLEQVFDRIRPLRSELPGEAKQMLTLERAYLDSIDPVVNFLQGRDPSLASRICQGHFLPQGPRFSAGLDRIASPQTVPTFDRARLLASLYLEDLADLVRATVAPQLALSRYAEQIGMAASSFDSILRALAAPPSLTDELMLAALWRHIEEKNPAVIGLTVPFPGNLYGAFRIAQTLKQRRPSVTVVLGGGYANTELRRLRDPRVFDYLDYVTLDDGERPLLCLLEHLAGKREDAELCRTFLRANDRVVFRNGNREPDFGMAETGTPTYDGLPLTRYLSILDTLNPMHRLWSDGHWNKLTVAHGCYWKQCTFCDVGLDYISRYEATPSEVLADRIEALIAETGRRGFHFVDEAAPPAGLKALALTLLERGITISWWGNIRFEEAFTADLCRLLAASGCVAVSAGLEAASDRLLEAMKKGITVAQAARVAEAFRQAGILVHAYLMYGCPGETVAETVESLERVRQLFSAGLIQSAFWHKFTATAHSPIGLAPDAHGIRITGPVFRGFAENDLAHEDRTGRAPAWLGEGLRRALFNYMEGRGLTIDVRRWFDRPVPRPKVPRDWVDRALAEGSREEDDPTAERRFVWIGGEPVIERHRRTRSRLILPNRVVDVEIRLSLGKAEWLATLIRTAMPSPTKRGQGYPLLRDVRTRFPFGGPHAFDAMVRSAAWREARAIGLLLV